MNRLKNFDLGIFLPMVLLLTFGLAVLTSLEPQLAREQLIFVFLGLVAYFAVTLTRTEYLRAFAPLFYLLSITLLLITLFLGTLSRGSIRWLPLGVADLTLQTSELSKFLLIVALSTFFSSGHWSLDTKGFLKSLLLIGLPAVLVFLQPDLGTTLILGAIWLILLLSIGQNIKFLLLLITLLLIFSPLAWNLMKPYQQQRLSTFLNPNLDPLGSGYHVLQSKIAIGSGQVFGRGWGQGSQSRLKFLPEYHNDFIFAALSEEWGLLGASLLLLLYFSLLYRLLSLTQMTTDPFERLLTLGTFAMIFSQFTINIGMNLGLAPITGIPLPLLSSGGSSMVTTLMSLGLAQSVALRRRLS